MSNVFNGLHARKTIMGMDRGLFGVLASISAYVIVFLPTSYELKAVTAAAFLFVFFWLRAQNKREPDLVKIYIKYAKQADIYEPWPDWRPKRNWRPIGFGDEKVLK